MIPNILNKKVKIRFIIEQGTSPIVGNIYFGKISELDKKTAAVFVDNGHAEYYDEKAAAENDTDKKELSDFNIPELKEKATEIEIDFASNIKKAPLIKAIEDKQKALAAESDEKPSLTDLSFDELKEKATELEIDFDDDIEQAALIELIDSVLDALAKDND